MATSLHRNLTVQSIIAGCALTLSLQAIAADSDHDSLPDDWETAHGLDTNVMDYSISSISGNTITVCTTTPCSTTGGVMSEAITTPVSLGYCHTAFQPSVGYPLKESYALECNITGNNAITCYAVYQTTVSASGSQSGSYPACPTQTSARTADQVIYTAGSLGHIISSPSRLCALSTQGVQCWDVAMSGGLSTSLTLSPQGLLSYPIDPDGDGINSDIDPLPLGELTLPKDGNYLGSMIQEMLSRQ